MDRDSLDLREIGGTLRRGWRWMAACVLTGCVLSLLATALLGPQFEGESRLLVRRARPASASLASLSGLSSLAGGFPLALGSSLDTELQILNSRTLVGEVVDSLGLQARILSPDGLSPDALFEAWDYEPSPEPAEYHFVREGNAYRVDGPGTSATVAPGRPVELRGASVVLREQGLPSAFTVALTTRQSAIDELLKDLDIESIGGEVVNLSYRGDGPGVAAAVPNLLVSLYLRERKTTDRGVNERRFEFLQRQADSISSELVDAESRLREHQERTGVLDPQAVGQASLDRSVALQMQLERVEVESRAVEQLLAQRKAGTVSVRGLAAYPTFLNNAAINDLLSRLMELATERTKLATKRTDADPEMIGLSTSIAELEDQLTALSRSYLTGLARQRASLQNELARDRAEMIGLPREAETSFRLQRNVKRLSETLLALQSSLVETRLASIGEGGDARVVDPAVVPHEPVFPKPWLNLAIGLFGGLVVGIVGAFSSVHLSPRVREPRDVELAAGVPGISLQPGQPLLLGGLGSVRTALVLPLGNRARSGDVARRLAIAAAARGNSVALVEWEDANIGAQGAQAAPAPPPAMDSISPGVDATIGARIVHRIIGGAESDPAAARTALEELEQENAFVVVALPGLAHPATEALLAEGRPVVIVGHPGVLQRAEVRETVGAFARAGIPTVGVVLQSGAEDRRAPRRS